VLSLVPPYAVYCRACCSTAARPLEDDERCEQPACSRVMEFYTSGGEGRCAECWQTPPAPPKTEPALALVPARELPLWTREKACPQGHREAWRWSGPSTLVCGTCRPLET
jgi:hypothetical protein